MGIAIAAVVIAIVLASSASSSHRPKSTAAGAQSGVAAGLQAGPAPWAPEYSRLATRLAALHLPGQTDAGFHIHAKLRVFVAGRQVQVPADIGIDPEGRFISPLHTHDTTGIIHMESTRPYPFTLGQFFTVWGVAFGRHQLGGYRDAGGRRVQVYVNGNPVANPVGYVMRAHDSVIVGYGKRGSFPRRLPTTFAPGL